MTQRFVTSGYISEESVYPYVHCSVLNSQDTEAAQVPINKEQVVRIHDAI